MESYQGEEGRAAQTEGREAERAEQTAEDHRQAALAQGPRRRLERGSFVASPIILIQDKTPAKHRDIFRHTLIAKKVWRRQGSNPRPTCWESKKFQTPARVRTQDLQPD